MAIISGLGPRGYMAIISGLGPRARTIVTYMYSAHTHVCGYAMGPYSHIHVLMLP